MRVGLFYALLALVATVAIADSSPLAELYPPFSGIQAFSSGYDGYREGRWSGGGHISHQRRTISLDPIGGAALKKIKEVDARNRGYYA